MRTRSRLLVLTITIAIELTVGAGCRRARAPSPPPDLLPVDAPVCNSDGWCWEVPRPQMGDLQGVWATGSGELWAVGEAGAFAWNGVRWSTLQTEPLRAVWGSAWDDVWAVGPQGSIRHWDGTAWTAVPSGTDQVLGAIWGSGRNDVWVGGASGFLLHFDGRAWTPVTAGARGSVASIWGTAADDVWVVDCTPDAITMLRWNGEAWTSYDSGWRPVQTVWVPAPPPPSPWPSPSPVAARSIWGMWGSGPDDIWVIGEIDGAIECVLTGSTVAGNHAYTCGVKRYNALHWNGVAWSTAPIVSPGRAISGVGPEDAWMAGGDLKHWNGAEWSVVPGTAAASLRGVWADGPSRAWAVGGGRVLGCDPQGCRSVDPTSDAPRLNAIWAAAPDDVWAVGGQPNLYGVDPDPSDAVLHWDGGEWSRLSTGVDVALTAVWGTASDDVWAVGQARDRYSEGVFLHWDGHQWRQDVSASVSPMGGVWGAAADDYWAVSEQAILHWDGRVWSYDRVLADEHIWLTGVSGSGPRDVWVVGYALDASRRTVTTLHWDGSDWSRVSVPDDASGVPAVWAAGPSDAWLAANGVFRWDGSAWTSFLPANDLGEPGALRITGRGPDDLYVVTRDSDLLRWNGGAWKSERTPFAAVAVGVAKDGEAWVVGATTTGTAAIAHRSP